VKGGKWFSLIDKVYSKENLLSAFKKVASNKGSTGVDHQTISMYESRLMENIEYLLISIKEGKYRPKEIKRVWIPKPGSKEKRPLGIPTVRDRIVQTSLRNVLEPIFEKDFAEQSYGFRPRLSCKAALRRVDSLLKSGYIYVVDVDLKSYFDTISHKRLMELIMLKVSDNRILNLIEMFLHQGILD
jgi:RNA-directed DNA polymerase